MSESNLKPLFINPETGEMKYDPNPQPQGGGAVAQITEDEGSYSSSLTPSQIEDYIDAGTPVSVTLTYNGVKYQTSQIALALGLVSAVFIGDGGSSIGATIQPDGEVTIVDPSAVKWYGVEIDESNLDPEAAVTRTGNMSLHASLPIQNNMKRCVLNADGTVNYYLDATDSTLQADGETPAVLDGTDGDVMVEIPEHYILVEKDGNTLSVKMSAVANAIDGAVLVPLHYISAYQATDDNGELKSLSGTGATGNMNIGEFRASATAKNTNGVTGWSQMQYSDAVDLYWLFVVEYKNRNSQAAVNNTLTAEGYRQGGLGDGCTYIDSVNSWPAVNNGTTNSLGNNSGEVSGITPLSGSGTTVVNSYHGIENPFGNLYSFYDGIVNLYGHIYRCADPADCRSFFMEADASSTARAYVQGEIAVADDNDEYVLYECIADAAQATDLTNTTYFSPTTMKTLGYELDATYTEASGKGLMSAVNIGKPASGSILGSTWDGDTSDIATRGAYCDASGVYTVALDCVYGGGCADSNAQNAAYYGLACVDASGNAFANANVNIGSRLCFHGNNAE